MNSSQDEWLGILLSRSQLHKVINNMNTFEKIQFYEEAAQKNGLRLCYFSMKDISFMDGTVSAYSKEFGQWEHRVQTIPRVIHNRVRFGSKHALKLKKLTDKGIVIFNQQNLYGKLDVAKILQKRKDFHPFLPETLPCTRSSIRMAMAKSPSFFIKPNKGTLGSGIKKVNQLSPSIWEICYRRKKEIVKEAIHSEQVPDRIAQMVNKSAYHVQERIALATFHGSPFDLRVSVQKGNKGDWSVTGIVAKVAKAGHFLSNVAKGGTCYQLEDIFEQLPHLELLEVKRNVESVALSFAQHLEKKLPQLADVGFDFGIDNSGHPFFIEMNLRDQRYSFAKANMEDTWKRTYENPVCYGKYLLRRKSKVDLLSSS